MFDTDRAAQVLFGETTGQDYVESQTPEPSMPTGSPTDAPAVSDTAKALFGAHPKENEDFRIDVPDDIRSARAEDKDRVFFDAEAMLGGVLNESTLFDKEDDARANAGLRAALAREVREMAVDIGMSAGDAQSFMSIARRVKTAPDERTRTRWHEEAVTRLNEAYGNEAARALRDAQRFVRADSRRVKLLEHRGLGDHPDVVMMISRLARQARNRGKLK